MPSRVRALTALATIGALVWSTGCAGWHRVELANDATLALARRQQVQVWRGGASTVVHAVRVTPDTVYGVPYHRPPSCDSCIMAFPRSEVDSMRLGGAEGAALGIAIGSLVALVFLLYVVCPINRGCLE